MVAPFLWHICPTRVLTCVAPCVLWCGNTLNGTRLKCRLRYIFAISDKPAKRRLSARRKHRGVLLQTWFAHGSTPESRCHAQNGIARRGLLPRKPVWLTRHATSSGVDQVLPDSVRSDCQRRETGAGLSGIGRRRNRLPCPDRSWCRDALSALCARCRAIRLGSAGAQVAHPG